MLDALREVTNGRGASSSSLLSRDASVGGRPDAEWVSRKGNRVRWRLQRGTADLSLAKPMFRTRRCSYRTPNCLRRTPFE
jgi:hypothetical protein